MRIFDRHGEREQRAKARLKFLIERIGWADFQAKVLAERKIVWATQSGFGLTALLTTATVDKPKTKRLEEVRSSDSAQLKRWRTTNVVKQKQANLCGILVRVPLGDISSTQLRGVANLAREYASNIRLTNTQNILLRSVDSEAIPRVYEELNRLGLAEAGADRMADITRCPGADSCLSAVTHPRGLAKALEQLFHNGLSSSADVPLSIKISGCTNSCGHHHIADLGFFGMAIKVGERHVPCYQVLVGGRTQEGTAQFGQRLIRIPAQRAPEAVKRVIALYHERRQPTEDFHAFIQRVGLATIEGALKDLADLSNAVQEPELFVDLGTTEPFELEAGKGECAE